MFERQWRERGRTADGSVAAAVAQEVDVGPEREHLRHIIGAEGHVGVGGRRGRR